MTQAQGSRREARRMQSKEEYREVPKSSVGESGRRKALEGTSSWPSLISTYVPLSVSYTAHMTALDFLNLRGH